MDIKIRNKFIEIKNSISDWFVIFAPFPDLCLLVLIVSLVFSHLGFWSGNLFLIAPFPDLCLLVLRS